MNIKTVGLDLAKNVFHIVGLDEHGHEKMMIPTALALRGEGEKCLSRSQVLKHFANYPACVIGMEACASSHYFAREFRKLGHEAKLIPPHESMDGRGRARQEQLPST